MNLWYCLSMTAMYLTVINFSNIRRQFSIKHFATYRHFQRVKGVFHNVIRVQVVNLPDGNIDIRLRCISEEEEFGPCQGVEALHTKVFRFQHFKTRGRFWSTRNTACRSRWRYILNGI